MVRQPDMFRRIRQSLISHVARCETCEATTDGRNAQGWASLHVKRNPGHVCTIALGYRVAEEAPL